MEGNGGIDTSIGTWAGVLDIEALLQRFRSWFCIGFSMNFSMILLFGAVAGEGMSISARNCVWS